MSDLKELILSEKCLNKIRGKENLEVEEIVECAKCTCDFWDKVKQYDPSDEAFQMRARGMKALIDEYQRRGWTDIKNPYLARPLTTEWCSYGQSMDYQIWKFKEEERLRRCREGGIVNTILNWWNKE
jgi:hypothetical protein